MITCSKLESSMHQATTLYPSHEQRLCWHKRKNPFAPYHVWDAIWAKDRERGPCTLGLGWARERPALWGCVWARDLSPVPTILQWRRRNWSREEALSGKRRVVDESSESRALFPMQRKQLLYCSLLMEDSSVPMGGGRTAQLIVYSDFKNP